MINCWFCKVCECRTYHEYVKIDGIHYGYLCPHEIEELYHKVQQEVA